MGGKIGATPPVSSLRVQTKQIALLQNFRSRTPQLVNGFLNNIVDRKVVFHADKLPAVKDALLEIMKVDMYKDLAQAAYQTLFKPIREVQAPAAPVVPQKIQLPPTTAEFLAEDCPVEVLLYVRAAGRFQEMKNGAFPGKAKGDARSRIKERVDNGSLTLDGIAEFIDSASEVEVIRGAIKTIGDLRPLSIKGKPADAYLEGLRDLAPDSAIGQTAAAVLKEVYEKEPAQLPPRPRISVVTPPPATKDVLKPVEVPKEDSLDFEEDAMTIPVPTMRPVAETTPETVLKYLQDEVSYLAQQDARLRQSLGELEKKSGELKKQGGERTEAVASLKAIIEAQSELYREQLQIAEDNYKASINVEEIKNLQAQIKAAETEDKDSIQVAILKETLRMAVDPLQEAYEEQKTQIKDKMNQALGLSERNAWINDQHREIASIKAELEGLSAQVGEIKDQLAANQDDARAQLERIDSYVKKLQVLKNALLKILPETEISKKS